MKLISFLEKQIKKWNDDKKCGQCYAFYAPLTEEGLNRQQISDCCINVMLTRDRVSAFGVDRTYNTNTGTLSDVWSYKNFNLYFLVPQPIGVNNYTEIQGNETDNSRSTVLEDLEECITDMELDFCEFIGNEWQLTQWSALQLINYQDNNYTGYRVTVSIRQRKIK